MLQLDIIGKRHGWTELGTVKPHPEDKHIGHLFCPTAAGYQHKYFVSCTFNCIPTQCRNSISDSCMMQTYQVHLKILQVMLPYHIPLIKKKVSSNLDLYIWKLFDDAAGHPVQRKLEQTKKIVDMVRSSLRTHLQAILPSHSFSDWNSLLVQIMSLRPPGKLQVSCACAHTQNTTQPT